MRHFAFLALPLMLAACNAEAPVAEDNTAVAEPAAEASLDLQATGLIVPAQNGFEQLDVPFGSMRVATEATLANVLGEMMDQGENAECEAGPLQFATYEGLTLYFQEDQFVGYNARAPFVPVLSRAEMLADPGVVPVVGSTLGEEFTIGAEGGPQISGLFTGAADDAAVETLWAGTNCIFR